MEDRAMTGRKALRRRVVFVFIVLAVLLSASASIADSQVAAAKDLLPGDPAPAFKVAKWLQKGVFDTVRPVNGRCITIIEFWADWCPSCRTVLPAHDRLQARLIDRGVRFLTVAEGQDDDTRDLLKQLRLRNLAVACDSGCEMLSKFVDPSQALPVPYVVVIEENGGHRACRILWKGPALTDRQLLSRYCSSMGLDEVMDRIVSGALDVREARAIERDRADAQWYATKMWDAYESGKLDRMSALANHVLGRSWPKIYQETLCVPLVNLADSLLDIKDADKSQLTNALKMVRAAIDRGVGNYAAIVHIYARALFRNGDVSGAAAAERRALSLPMDYITKEECANALTKYEAALLGKTAYGGGTAKSEQASVSDAKLNDKTVEFVTAEQAAADLTQLHNSMRTYYAGYDDMAQHLASQGSSWKKRNSEFVTRIRAQDRWSTRDLMCLLVEYAKPIPDNHFLFGLSKRNWQAGMQRMCPRFADVRVREYQGRMIVQEASTGLAAQPGDQIVDVPVIGTCDTMLTGRAYLFPTLRRQPAGGKEYLVGVFAPGSSTAESVIIHIRGSSDGQGDATREVALPLHRGRSFYGQQDNSLSAWSLDQKPLPVLTIRRFWGEPEEVEGLPRTAVTLRERPVVVVDLRGNGGGNADLGMRWFARLSNQVCVFPCLAGLKQTASGSSRWNCTFRYTPRDDSPEKSDRPYGGRLFVITDAFSGSASEWFADAAAQLPGATLVGENTSGTFSYAGNEHICELPNSGICAKMGRSKFARFIRPDREGVGMFPDYWLDDPDPLAAIAAYCSLE